MFLFVFVLISDFETNEWVRSCTNNDNNDNNSINDFHEFVRVNLNYQSNSVR